MTLDENNLDNEKSVFGTRLPRPASSNKHLFIVLLCSALALVAAIFYAEKNSQLSMKETTLPVR